MRSFASTVAIACWWGLAMWPGVASARDERRGDPPARASGGQEVVNGYYQCSGSVYTDDQPASIGINTYLSATSGITSDFFPIGQSSQAVPADLDAMSEICEANVGEVIGQVPGICTLGPIENERGTWGNGSSVSHLFEFSCQGSRDQVIGVIGLFSRTSLTLRLP
jgi:hypothetical protein